MDLLSDVLQTLRLSGAIFLRGEFTSPWGIAAPGAEEIGKVLNPGRGYLLVFHIVAKGRCRIELDNGTVGEVEAPGVLLMPQGHAHSLADGEGRLLTPSHELLPPPPWTEFPCLSHGGGGEATRIICGYLHFSNVVFAPLLKDLPDLIALHFPQDKSTAGLRSILDYATHDAEVARPGAVSLVFRLAELFFVEVLRHQAPALSLSDSGWYAALQDPVVTQALQQLHTDPARAWTIEDLARSSDSSRSTLTERFRLYFGYGPMQYLSKWRVQSAAAKLMQSDVAVATAAAEAGYESESAFKRAFKRELGMSPKTWRKLETTPGRTG